MVGARQGRAAPSAAGPRASVGGPARSLRDARRTRVAAALTSMLARRSLSDQRRPGTSSGEGRLPTFLIIGASKSGTTSLAAYLSQHPEVFMSSRKEINFFDLHYGEGVDWYRAHFADAGDRREVGEATPTYFLDD